MTKQEFKDICVDVFKEYGTITFKPCPAVRKWPQAYLQYFHAKSQKLVARYYPDDKTAMAISTESDYDDSHVENPESFRTILKYVRDHLDYIFLRNYITIKNQGPW